MKNKSGFTLVELLIVVSILGILVAIAYPQYKEHMIKTRRTDGKTALLDLAARMERYYTEKNTFVGATIAAGNASTDIIGSNQSQKGYYTLSIASQTATTYSLQAAPNGTQATDDTACANFKINELGAKTVSGSGTVATCW